MVRVIPFIRIGPTAPPPDPDPDPDPPVPGDTLTQVFWENTSGSSLGRTYYTFGQGFPQGDVPSDKIVVPTDSGGADLPHQAALRCTWPDGSLRWAEWTVSVPSIGAGQSFRIDMKRATGSWNNTPSRSNADFAPLDLNLLVSGMTSASGGTVGSGNWRATLAEALAGSDVLVWSDGPVARSVRARTPLRDQSGGAAHPTLICTFYVTVFTDPTTGAIAGYRHSALVGQHWIFTQQHIYRYDAVYRVGSTVMRSFSGLTHPAYSCWATRNADGLHYWSGSLSRPPLHVRWNAAGKRYWKRSWLIPNFFDDIVIDPATDWLPFDYVPTGAADYGGEDNNPGDRNLSKAGSDDNAHFGLITHWATRAFISQEPSYVKHDRVCALIAGHIPVHGLDENTGRILNASTVTIPGMGGRRDNTAYGFSWNSGGSPKPQGGTNGWVWDDAHYPSPIWWTYLREGGQDILDLHMMWSNWILGGSITNNINRYRTAGGVSFRDIIVRRPQLRGSGHSIREWGYATAIAPDGTPEKTYFETVLEDNIDFGDLRINQDFGAGERYVGYWDTRNINEYGPSFFYYHWINGLCRAYMVTRNARLKSVYLEHMKNYLMGQMGKDYHCVHNWMAEYRGSTVREYEDGPFLTSFSRMSGPDPTNCSCSATNNTITMTNKVGGRANRLSNGDRVRFTIKHSYQTPNASMTQPSTVGLDHTKLYYVRNKSGDTFQLSETPNGPIVDITANGGALRMWAILDNPNVCPTYGIELGKMAPATMEPLIGFATTGYAGIAMLEQVGVTNFTFWYNKAKSIRSMVNPTFNAVYAISAIEDGTSAD